jgi:hypothetical protein
VIRLGRIVFGMGRLARFLNSVALGVPGDPAVCWAKAGVEQNAAVSATRMVVFNAFRFMSPSPFLSVIKSCCLQLFLLPYLPADKF